MAQFTLLYGARQLITLRGASGARRGSDLQELSIIENGSVLIENGHIYSLGSTRRIENLKEARNAFLIDASGSVVMPGLIDPDVSVTLTGPVGQSARPNRIYEGGLALMRSCLQHGTVTAVLKMSAELTSYDADLCLLRQFKRIGKNPVDAVRAWHIARPPNGEANLSCFEGVLDRLSKRRLFDSISISSLAASGEDFDLYLKRIISSGLPTDLQWRGGAFRVIADLMAQTKLRAVSCSSHLTTEEAGLLSASDAVVVFSPGSEVGHPSGGGLRRVVDAGGAVALASGYHPVHTPGFSMQMAISLAALHGGLSVEEAITAATVNAAYAAGCGDTTGTIERGKRANLLVLSIPDYRQIPRQFGINHIATVLKDGDVVLNRGGWKMNSSAAAVSGMRSQHLGRA